MLSIEHKDCFINDGPFFDSHPDIYPFVTRYEKTDSKDHIVESWERGEDGRMHDVTKRDQLREELRAAQEQINKLQIQEALTDVTPGE